MDSLLVTALTVAVPAVIASTIAPLLLAWMNARNIRQQKLDDEEIRRRERQEDSKRQDEVARKVAEVVKVQATASGDTIHKLDMIHTLVNSNMTTALQAELAATRRELLLMEEVITLKQASGHEPTQQSIVAMEATKTEIAKMEANLRERLVAVVEAHKL